MIHIQGIPVVAERLQKAHRPVRPRARQLRAAAPRSRKRQPPDEFQSGIEMEPRTMLQGIERRASLPTGTDRVFGIEA
jgi:hypothetical protein